MVERRYFQVPLHYTKKKPVQALVRFGGAKYLGLYMALYEDSINRNGTISRASLMVKAIELGVSKKSFTKFLGVAMAQHLIVPCNEKNLYGLFFLPDVKVLEARRKLANERLRKLLQVVEGQTNAV